MTRRTDAASATASPDAHPRPTQGGPDDSLLLSVLLSRMDQGVRLDAPDGRPLRWNAAYERMFPELSPALRDGTAGPGHGGVEDGEDAALRRRPDGRRYRCDRHDFPDGSRLSLWSEVSDPAAEGRNAQLSDLLERMDQGVIMVDADMKVLAINRRLLDLYDVPHDLFPDPRYEDYIRFSAGRGEYGPGDPEEHVRRKLALARRDDVPIYEHVRPGRGVVEVRTRRLPGGGFVKTYTDITARKRAEAELARKSEMLRQTLENIGQGIALLDADLRIVTYNRKLLDLLGIPEEMAARLPTLEDISRFQLGTRQILLPPDAPDFGDDVEAQVRYLMERLGRPERELTYARPQADGRFIEVHIVPLPDGGQVRTYTDITDRLIADEAVRQSREILKGVIDAIPALIDVRDRERRLQLVNRHYRDTYGIEPGDLEDGATPVAGGGSSAERLDRLVIETGRGIPFFEESHPDTEGRRRHWLTTKMPLTDEGGEVSHIVTVALDITARKRAEEELARKSALLQAVLESIGQGLSAFDDELRLVAWNRRFLELLGFPPEYGAVGRPFADFVRFNVDRGSYGPGDPEEQVRARVELAMQPVPHRFERVLSDGRVIEVEGAPMEGGGFVSTFTDVTERKQAEAELLAAKDRAEQALTDLRIAQENLIQAEKMASLAQLVAGVAHEVNTPIGVTLTAISHLGEEVGKIRALFDAGRVRRSDFQDFLDVAWESTRMIMTNIERAVALIQSFKQVAVDQASDERRAFDLAGYVNEVLLSLRPRLRKSRVRVTADIQPDLIVDSYPGAFSQVLSNLIMNALVHAFEEGQEGHIELTARETDPGWVELRYRDDGKGIADSIRSYIFDPFFTTKRGAGASGLGLSICYNIMTRTMGGSIALESEEGKGACFLLRFPRRLPDPADSAS